MQGVHAEGESAEGADDEHDPDEEEDEADHAEGDHLEHAVVLVRRSKPSQKCRLEKKKSERWLKKFCR